MNKAKIYCVSLDGIDKSGKTTLVKYLAKLSNYTLNVLDRGPITNIVWNKIQKRDVDYDLEMWRNAVFVRLNVDKEDWQIRCSIHNEPPMPYSYEDMNKAYDEVFTYFKENAFYTMEFNTTRMSQYMIAKKIIECINEVNEKACLKNE